MPILSTRFIIDDSEPLTFDQNGKSETIGQLIDKRLAQATDNTYHDKPGMLQRISIEWEEFDFPIIRSMYHGTTGKPVNVKAPRG